MQLALLTIHFTLYVYSFDTNACSHVISHEKWMTYFERCMHMIQITINSSAHNMHAYIAIARVLPHAIYLTFHATVNARFSYRSTTIDLASEVQLPYLLKHSKYLMQ